MTTTTATTATTPRTTHRTIRVSSALWLDAAASGALGVALAAATPVVEEWFGLPAPLSLSVAAFLLAWAGFCAWVARDPRPGLVREVTLLNLAWIVASIAFLVADPVGLTVLGQVLVVAQAGAVAGFVALTTAASRTRSHAETPSIGA